MRKFGPVEKLLAYTTRFSRALFLFAWQSQCLDSYLRRKSWNIIESWSIFFWVGQGLLWDVDTIQEFSLILSSYSADLIDLSAWKRETGVINTVKDNLSLVILWLLDSASFLKVDEMTLLTTEEVLNFNLFSVLGDLSLDGEMCMYKSHLVSETL